MSEFGKGIPLASGFDLGAKKPLDSRDVVDTIEERDLHVAENRAYEGMTVYVKENKTIYRYDGKNWIDLSNFYTKEEVEQQINSLQAELDNKLENSDLNNYAKKSDIPTKTSELTNDSGFLTSIPDEYITEEELNEKGYLTEHQDLSNYATKDELFSKDYNDLTNKPTIPSLNGYATESFVSNAIANAQLSGDKEVDLSNYATKDELNSKANITDIPTKVSDLTNDNNYISSIPDEYITEEELNNTIEKYYTKNEVDEKIKDNNNNNETIQNLLDIIESLQSQIQKLQEDVEYLKTHGGGGTIPDDDENEDVVNDGVLILEDGFELLLEDGSSILLEGNTDGGDNKEEEKDNIILLEDGFELLLEDGSNFLLDVA